MMATAMLIFKAVDKPFEDAPVCDSSVGVEVTSDCVAVDLVEAVVEAVLEELVVDDSVSSSVNLVERVKLTKHPLVVVFTYVKKSKIAKFPVVPRPTETVTSCSVLSRSVALNTTLDFWDGGKPEPGAGLGSVRLIENSRPSMARVVRTAYGHRAAQ